MEKEELLNRIAEAFGAGDKEIKIAYDTFLQKLSEELIPGEAVRIPGFGIFQVKEKSFDKYAGYSQNDENIKFQLLYFPNDSDEVIELDFVFSDKAKRNLSESAFSLSTGKPIIPISESQKKELLIQSSYLNLLNDFQEKADELFKDAIKLDNFNLDASHKETEEISFEQDDFSTLADKEENIPWNFGDEINNAISEPNTVEETPMESSINQTSDEININPDDMKNISFDPFSFGVENPMSEDELEGFNEGLKETEITSDEQGIETNDILNSNESRLDVNDLLNTESYDFDNFNIDSEENKEYEESTETAEDSDLSEEKNINEPGDMSKEEESDENEIVTIDVDKAREFTSSKSIPLEEVGENEVNVKYSKWFWVVLLVLLTVTGGGLYYFLIFKGQTSENKIAQITPKAKKVETQVIERDYKIPVAVIPKSNEGSTEKTPSEIKSKSGEQTVDKTENKPAESKVENNNKTQMNINTNKDEKVTGASQNKSEDISKKNKNTVENIKKPGSNKEDNTSSLQPEIGLERKDNKNTLVQNNIFTDGMKYTIQLSSWKSRAVAEKEVQHLRKQGLDAYITQSYVPTVGETRYRVRVGEYNTVEGAEAALKKIK